MFDRTTLESSSVGNLVSKVFIFWLVWDGVTRLLLNVDFLWLLPNFGGSGWISWLSGSESTIGGGYKNTASGNCAFIGGGKYNTASGNYSVIGGGCTNTASGNDSAILGGRYNNTNNCNSAMIIGGYITADRVNATFVNNLSIMNIPTASAGLPSGSVWKNGAVLNIV